MPRPGLAPGEHGEIWVKPAQGNGYVARVRVRDRDGRVRDVTSSGPSKGAAKRALERRLAQRTTPTDLGIRPTMTIETAAGFWLEQREKSGAVRPQTVAAYADAARLVVIPALGALKVSEATVGLLDGVLGDLEATGISTALARSVLNQTLALAVRHGALATNPMQLVSRPERGRREVEVLELEQARRLRTLVAPRPRSTSGGRPQNADLAHLVDIALGTGGRVGEILGLRWQDVDLNASAPTVKICGTLIEPRAGYVTQLARQDSTKSKSIRTLILPPHVADLLAHRRDQTPFDSPDHPVLCSSAGTFLYPANLRTRLRAAVAEASDLLGTTPHTLRRTVGTLVAHEVGLDAAREVLGHAAAGTTWQHYVAARPVAPDVRDVLDQFFTD